MSVPYPADESQHLQIPDPDRTQSYYSPPAASPFIDPQLQHFQEPPGHPQHHPVYPPPQGLSYQDLPYPPPQHYPPYHPPPGHPHQHPPYPTQQQALPTNPEHGQNFQESMSSLNLNEGLQDIGKNLLKQGK